MGGGGGCIQEGNVRVKEETCQLKDSYKGKGIVPVNNIK